MKHLSGTTLNEFVIASKPKYNRQNLQHGILHIGLGGFHRAHQAVYTEAVLNNGDLRWGITGASLKRPTMRELLAQQDFLYTLGIKHHDAVTYQVIGAIQNVVTLNKQQTQLVDLIASPQTKIITLTITEKGYCLDTANELDITHPDIRWDIEHPTKPVSAPGLITLGLMQRMIRAGGKLSIVSCDNVAGNGRAAQRAIHALTRLVYPTLSTWLQDNVSFPNSMVDRIVPAASENDVSELCQRSGFEDPALVVTEPFSQWVIEDNFMADRPAWEIAGAQWVNDVAPWEAAKLRLLNATHSAVAYLGLLCGYQFVHEAMSDPAIARFARYLLDQEISPVIQCPAGFALSDYKTAILERFANQHVQYPTAQVATDGAQKLIQRIFPSIDAHITRQSIAPGLNLVVAAWLHCRLTPTFASQFADSDVLEADGNASGIVEANRHLLGILGQNQEFLTDLANTLDALRIDLPQNIANQITRTAHLT